MRIVILFGSPNASGSTSILTDRFIEGATEAGHTCELIDVCHMDAHSCTGCVACGYEGPCVQKDDVEGVRAKLLAADMVAVRHKPRHRARSIWMRRIGSGNYFDLLVGEVKTIFLTGGTRDVQRENQTIKWSRGTTACTWYMAY